MTSRSSSLSQSLSRIGKKTCRQFRTSIFLLLCNNRLCSTFLRPKCMLCLRTYRVSFDKPQASFFLSAVKRHKTCRDSTDNVKSFLSSSAKTLYYCVLQTALQLLTHEKFDSSQKLYCRDLSFFEL